MVVSLVSAIATTHQCEKALCRSWHQGGQVNMLIDLGHRLQSQTYFLAKYELTPEELQKLYDDKQRWAHDLEAHFDSMIDVGKGNHKILSPSFIVYLPFFVGYPRVAMGVRIVGFLDYVLVTYGKDRATSCLQELDAALAEDEEAACGPRKFHEWCATHSTALCVHVRVMNITPYTPVVFALDELHAVRELRTRATQRAHHTRAIQSAALSYAFLMSGACNALTPALVWCDAGIDTNTTCASDGPR